MDDQAKQFIGKIQSHILKGLAGHQFPLKDPKQFAKIKEPHRLGSSSYQVYIYRKLKGFSPNVQKEHPLLYTFLIFEPSLAEKSRFIQETKKPREERSQQIVGDYYLNFTPTRADFQQTCRALERMLASAVYPGRGYQFAFHASTVDQNFNFVLVFLVTGSFRQCLTDYLQDNVFDPGVKNRPLYN